MHSDYQQIISYRQCLNGKLVVTETFQYVATYLVHTKVTSQTIIYPNPNPNKKTNAGPEFLTLFLYLQLAAKEGYSRV